MAHVEGGFASLMHDTPTVKVKGAFVGTSEVKGRFTSPTPIETHFTGQPAVWCQWRAEQHVRALTDSYWETIEHGTDAADQIHVTDDTGALLVDLSGADVRAERTFFEVRRGKPVIRRTEYALLAGRAAYAIGAVRMRDDAAVLEMRREPGSRRVSSARSIVWSRSATGPSRPGRSSTSRWIDGPT